MKNEVMVWSDDTGKYKVGYSQKLQQEQVFATRLLLYAVIVLIIILIIGGIYGYSLIQRIDALDPLARMVC